MNILVMELSTTSAKVMVYNTETQNFTVAEKAYLNQKTNQGLHDAEEVCLQTFRLARETCVGRKIDAIALSGTWHSLILCGPDMKPKTPSFLWPYTGAKDICAMLRRDAGYVREYYQKTGCMVHAIYPFFKLKHLANEGWDISKYHIMGQGSYTFFRLTGARAVMDSMASGTGMLNIQHLQFDQSLLDELGIHIDQLPVPGKWNAANPLTAEAARILDLQEGIPVLNAGPDGALNQLGSNALDEGIMTLSVGTSAAIRMSVSKPVLSKDISTWCYLSPKSWLSGAATSGACNCIDWIRNLMFPAETTYSECETGQRADIENAPVFLPFLFGERSPGWDDNRRALFSGILPEHNSYDYYYGVQEGVLFTIYQCYLKLCGLNGQPDRIKISGGILNSRRWLQMCADILNKELTIDSFKHSSMIGALALALEFNGFKVDPSFYGRADAEIVVPEPKMHERLMERFKKYMDQYEAGRLG